MRFKLGKRADYAVRATLALAQPGPSRRKARSIAEAMAIPETYVPQILADLVRAGICASQAGPEGGYALARDAAEISLLDVIEAVEPEIRSTECILRGGPCRWEDACAVHETWARAQDALLDELASSSFQDLAMIDTALRQAEQEAERQAEQAAT